jgi:hypothetical protein
MHPGQDAVVAEVGGAGQQFLGLLWNQKGEA